MELYAMNLSTKNKCSRYLAGLCWCGLGWRGWAWGCVGSGMLLLRLTLVWLRCWWWQRWRLLVAGWWAGPTTHWEVVDRDAVGGDVMYLSRRGHVDPIIGLHLDLVTRRQEGVEAHNEVRVALEELRDTADHPRGVYAVGDGATGQGVMQLFALKYTKQADF